MYLKRLEIHGFKSFAQKAALEFSKGIIAIVGPNGSGKSNVADAIRWVLGEQSVKLVRGKKSDDVIFAGSDKKVRLGFAEVAATFDNADRRIPVDAAEVSIGRRIDRSGESEYLINGNKVRLLDVVDLVLKSNIGTSRYTVIGQGTIDQMILAGPTEVKNLIDEASGVKTYYIKREKTLRRLEQTAQNLIRVEDLMAEIEPRLKSLRRQAKKMEARSEIETELKQFQREFFGATWWQLHEQIKTFEATARVFEEKKKKIEQEIAGQRHKIEQQEAGQHGENRKYKELQQSLDKLQSQKNRLLEDLSMVRGKMQSQKTIGGLDAKTLQVEVHNKETAIAELRQKIAVAKAEGEKLQEQLLQQKQLLESSAKKLDSLYTAAKLPTQIDWSLFDLELKSLDQELQNFETSVEQAQNVEQVKAQVKTLRQSFAKFKTVVDETARNPKASLAHLQEELEKVLKQKEEVNDRVLSLELGASKSKITLDFSEKQLQTLEQEKLHFDLELKKAQSGSIDEFWADLAKQERQIQGEAESLGAQIKQAENAFKAFYDSQDSQQKSLHEAESILRREQDALAKLKDEESKTLIEKAKVDTQMQVLHEEMLRILGEAAIAEIAAKKIESHSPGLEEKILKLKNQLDMIGGMDELTLKEYQETESRYTNLHSQVEDLKKSMQDLRQIMDELDEHIRAKFNEAFHKINEKFENYFRVLFNGGRAYLSIIKEEEKLSAEEIEAEGEDKEEQSQLRPEEKVVQKYEKGASNIIGIDMKATPPGKKLSTIQALSGGERALTSIALLCALLTCFPSPFVVLDEVDAALDEANTIRFGQILGSLAHQTQFITITHNRETMAQANILYGVTMGDDGISKLLSVKLDQAKAYAK